MTTMAATPARKRIQICFLGFFGFDRRERERERETKGKRERRTREEREWFLWFM